jgi:hypothetical protein
MNKLLNYTLFSFLLLIISNESHAQSQGAKKIDWSPEIYQVGKMYPGYIIQLNGDTTHGFLKAGARCAVGGLGNSNQNQAEFYLYETDKKPVDKYSPTDIKGYLIGDKLYESIAYSGGLLKKPNFNLVETEGAIRIFFWYSTVENFMMIQQQSGESLEDYDARRYQTSTVVSKPGLDPIEYAMLAMGFAKKMPEFIADYPALATKVAEKESGYKSLDIFKVIEEYNTWKASN